MLRERGVSRGVCNAAILVNQQLGSRVVAAVHQPGVGTIGVVDSIHLQEVRYCVTFVIDQSGCVAGVLHHHGRDVLAQLCAWRRPRKLR